MATHPRSLRARLIVFEPVAGICLPRRPLRSLNRVNCDHSDDGDHNLARDGRSALACVTEHVETIPKRHRKGVEDQVGLSRKSAARQFPLFLAPTYCFLQSEWFIEKLRYDHANGKHIAKAREVNEKMGIRTGDQHWD